MYYTVYTLNYFEIILLHCHTYYYTKYLIWCYGYNLYRIQLLIVQDSQNAPSEMTAVLITTSSQLQTQFSQRDL